MQIQISLNLHVAKVYAWRDLLEEREQKSAAYKSTKVKWNQESQTAND